MNRTIRLGTALLAGICLFSCVENRDARKREARRGSEEPRVTSNAERLAPIAPPRPVGIRPALTRAVWVDAWGTGFETPDRCDELIAWCEERGVNTIIVQVRRTGDAFYESGIEPRGRIGGLAITDDFDPLRYLVERAHDAKGLRVEAWIVANRLWQSDATPPATQPAHLVETRPEWLMMNRAGETASDDEKAVRYLDPALPAVRAHLARVAADIARRYRVDAVHLDYIRYPDRDWGYGKASIERFRRERRREDFPAIDDADFIAWRAKQVELTVAEIRRALRLASPDCELTAAVVLWGDPPRGGFEESASYRAAFQDWPRWCREGLVDAVYPMHYRRDDDAKQKQAFRAWLEHLAALPLGDARLVIGLGAYLNDRAGLAAQIDEVGNRRDFAGYALFSYRNPRR